MKAFAYVRLFLALVIVALATASCNQEKDLYNPQSAEAYLRTQYEQNFIRQYGTVPSGYSWDISGVPSWAPTRASSVIDLTPTVSADFEEVDYNVVRFMQSELKEQRDNRAKGHTFVMVVPNNEFTIVPIFQGNSGSVFDLYIEVGGVSKKLVSKGEGMEMQTEYYKRATPDDEFVLDHTAWVPLNTGSRMDAATPTYYTAAGKTTTDQTLAVEKRVTDITKVRSRQYTLDLTAHAGEIMTFYILITKGSEGYSTTGDVQSSIDGFMLDLQDTPRPATIDEDMQMMMIGCEVANDNDGHKSDWDLNDYVFMVYGKPYTPIVVEVKDDMVDRVTEKRYMFEDLGQTDDFDFNDVVLDLKETATCKLHYENGLLVSETVESCRQEAVVRHLGGVLPFTLFVGERAIYSGGSPATFVTDPNTFIPLDDTNPWKPAENNVSMRVSGNEAMGLMVEYVVSFPDPGSPAPIVIATSPAVRWLDERQLMTREWFESHALR